MIYIKFTVDSRLKKIISSNKKYSLQEASSILEKLEEHTKNNKSIESVEYSILENQDLLFRDRYITENGNQTDIILLVKETLDTVFRDYPQGEKDLLLNILDKAMNENIDSSYEEIYNYLLPYAKGARCTYPGFKCTNVCMWGAKNALTRKI